MSVAAWQELPLGQSRPLAPPIGTYRQSIEIATVPGPHRLAAGIVHLVMADVACQWGELSEHSRPATVIWLSTPR
jgi:hypothetical protein